MKQSQILELTYPHKLHTKLKEGEKICRNCEISHLPQYEGAYCLKCGRRLATKSIYPQFKKKTYIV